MIIAPLGIRRPLLQACLAGLVSGVAAAQTGGARTIEFEATRVTAPDIAVSPDGQWIVFTMLGKLFRIAVKGGDAEQITFGPYYDNDPAISPDGRWIAFQSDRDGSEGNIFLYSIDSKAITQLTHENWADRPAWAPDGLSIVYLRLERAGWKLPDSPARPPATIRRIRLGQRQPESLSAIGSIWSAFDLPDGRLAWTRYERPDVGRPPETRLEALERDGTTTVLRTFEGLADPVFVSPDGRGIYARHSRGSRPRGGPQEADLVLIPLGSRPPLTIAPHSSERSGFAVSADTAAYFGNLGRIWKARLPDGPSEAVPLRARVSLAVQSVTPTPRWTPPTPGVASALRTIEQPRISPDGSRLVFRALGRLWHQSVSGGRAERLTHESQIEHDPAFSPDSRQLAFWREDSGLGQIHVFDLRSKQTRAVGPVSRCGYAHLSWSKRGHLVAAVRCDNEVIAIDPANGRTRSLVKIPRDWGYWEPYPALADDGRSLHFQIETRGKAGLYRVPIDSPTVRVAVLDWGGDRRRLATNAEWIVGTLPNRPGLTATRVVGGAVPQAPLRRVTELEVSEFSMTADGGAVLVVDGKRLWKVPLSGGAPTEISIRLELTAPTPAPLLVERVRLLDFAAGGFTNEVSLLVEGGRIRSIGAGPRDLPAGTVRVDAAGRFAVPGLFDSHVHGNGCGAAPRLSFGVTSATNMGGRLAAQNVYADRGDFSANPMPRCFYPGSILEAPPGRNEDGLFVHVTEPEDARAIVRVWRTQGAQFIKIYESVAWPVQSAAADEARRLGLPVHAHGLTLEQVVKGVTLGFAGLTHWGNQFYDDVFQMCAAAGTRWEPTLGRSGFGWEVSHRRDPVRFRGASLDPHVGDLAISGFWADRMRMMLAAYRRGITLLPGTDGGPNLRALHWELEYYAEAGIPAIDVLRFATKSAAEAVGAGEHLGSLETGKVADVLLLDANPLEDIRNTQAIWRVLKGGWMFDPKELRPDGN